MPLGLVRAQSEFSPSLGPSSEMDRDERAFVVASVVLVGVWIMVLVDSALGLKGDLRLSAHDAVVMLWGGLIAWVVYRSCR